MVVSLLKLAVSDLGNVVCFCRGVADSIFLILQFDSLLTLITYFVMSSQI